MSEPTLHATKYAITDRRMGGCDVCNAHPVMRICHWMIHVATCDKSKNRVSIYRKLKDNRIKWIPYLYTAVDVGHIEENLIFFKEGICKSAAVLSSCII